MSAASVAEGGSVVADGEFAAWVEPHLSSMARLSARLVSARDCDDVVQEALTAAWRKRAQFDPARGGLRSWLLAIVADQARKSARHWRRIDLVAEVAEVPSVQPGADLDLERAIRALPARQRLAVELYYFVDLPVEEVAEVMTCSAGTVKSTLSDARARLSNTLGKDFR